MVQTALPWVNNPALVELPYVPHRWPETGRIVEEFRDQCGVVVLFERTRLGDVVLDVLSTLQPLDAALAAWASSSLSLALRVTHVAFATWPLPSERDQTRDTRRAMSALAREVLRRRQ